MSVFIPPEGLRFRLVGYTSQCAIFSRNDPEPEVGHYHVSHGQFPDQWFTLLHGKGDHSGLYVIKGELTGKVLFSRSAKPAVGHIAGDCAYDDSWFKIEPGPGHYACYFRLITPSTGLALYSRVSQDPTFGNHAASRFHSDQLFHFEWEDMKVDKVEYNLKDVKISSTPIGVQSQVLTNESDYDQELNFSITKDVVHTSTFEFGDGFTVTHGMEFNADIPQVSGGVLILLASTNTWIWGKTNQYSTQYTETFSVNAGPHKSIRGTLVISVGTLFVPYTIYMSSKGSGVEVQTSGRWQGFSTWDPRHTITPVD